MHTESITSQLEEALSSKKAFLDQADKLDQIVTIIESAVKSGGAVYACGNGGSACDAMHFVEECVARYKMERPGIKAHHLCDPGTITCWGNDYCFEEVFERQVATLMSEKDILMVFSTSGNSENILRALAAANKLGAHTIALLGKKGGAAKSLARTSLIVDSEQTSRIQEAHITAVHIIVETLENSLFST